MTQPPLHLVIGNYNTSSWSLRAWLVLRLARLAFMEKRIPLRMAETPGRIAEVSPSGKLPVLLAEGVPIWDSLAIAEFVAELEPGIWPLDPIARAEARSVSAEMHSGFVDLRRLMPMDVVGRFSPPGRLPRGLAADIDRIKAIWRHCRARFASHGPFLFGAFSIADCMMAPVATRFVTHGVAIDGQVEDYVDSVMSWPDMVTWCDAAAAEQVERDAQGALNVVAISRLGRVLGREPADPAPVPTASNASVSPLAVATAVPPALIESDRAGLDTKLGDADPGHGVEEARVPDPTPSAASMPSTCPEAFASAVSGDADPGGNGSGDERDTPRASFPAEPNPPALVHAGSERPSGAVTTEQPAQTDHVQQSDQPPPRRRLFEPTASRDAPSPAPAGPGVSPPASGIGEEADGAPSAADRHAPVVEPGVARAPAPKLGWIRRPVPVEQLEETEAPVGDEALPAPRRQAAAPAVKPIGGGILRRR